MQTMHVHPGLCLGCFVVVACEDSGRFSPSSWMARLASASSACKASSESGSRLAALIFLEGAAESQSRVKSLSRQYRA